MYTPLYYYLAMACTLAAWSSQLYTTAIKKQDRLNYLLPIFYFLACVFFTTDTIVSGNICGLVCNVIVGLVVLAVWIVRDMRKRR